MKAEIETDLGMIISEQTVRHRLYEVDFKGHVARKKPHVDKANVPNVFNMLKHIEMSLLTYFWDQVLWTDENKFNLFRSDGKSMAW